MEDDTHESKWKKVKKSISKGVAIAKTRWQEIKSDFQENSDNESYQSYGQTTDSQSHPPSNSPELSRVICSFCHTAVPKDLLSQLDGKTQIICENCGMEIEL